MKCQLNPSVETFLLLLNPDWEKEHKREAIKKLDDFGLNGIAFYAAHLPVVEQYHAAFGSQMVRTGGQAIFQDMCEELVCLYLPVLLSHPEWLEDFNAVSDEEVLAVVRGLITNSLECEEGIIDALEASGLSDQAKWQMTALLQQPSQRLGLVFDAINANLSAFEYAYTKLETEITPLLTQLEEQLREGDLSAVAHQSLQFNPKAQVIPSMAAALGLMVFEVDHDGFCVYGLLANRLFSGQDEGLTKAEALLAAKALSDTSKLDILLALRKESLYNQEIARMLGLTPATTSHHMSMLLSACLVEVSKRDGKAYYSLSADGLKRYRDWLDDSFLASPGT